MHGRIFRVDLSDEARDFQATATEPGLAMLDRNSANHAILRRWLDDFVAEPEWTEGDSANFYVYSEERGRVERLDVRPARKSDLEGPLQGELEALRAKIKKVKPESSTEELLHRIIRQTFARLTNDLSQSDHDSYFFKYREPGGPWKLLWCWGYQRKDSAQPATAVICGNSECEQLFVRRARTKPLCPGCQKIVRKKSAAAAVLSGRSLLILLLLLLAGAALLGIFNPPHLVVTPEQWNVPVSSRVEFQVAEHKWYFFQKDVTPLSHPQSHDNRVLDFAKVGPVAYAKSVGTTWVTFRHKDRVADVQVVVGPPSPPDSLEIVPAQVRLGIGSTARLQVQGIYDGGATVDVTDLIQWKASSEEIVFVHEGRLEGLKPGTVLVSAAYPSSTGDAALEASANVQVAQVDYQSLDMTLDPASIGVDEYGQLDVFALDEAGEKYSFVGSSQLALVVNPFALAEVEDEYLVGRQQGTGDVTAKVSELSQSLSFSVGDASSLAAGTFSVTPAELSLRVHEYYDVDVATASDEPIDVVSSDSAVVEVIAGTEIAGGSPGVAEVTFSQGTNRQAIKVTVVESNIETIRIIPSLITLRVGEAASLRVVGVSPDGEELALAPAQLTWKKQPAADYADFDRQSLQFFGLATTGEPEPLVVQFGEDLLAEAQVEVVGSPLAVDLAADFLVPHPPLRVGPSLVNPGAYLGGNYVFDNGGLMVRGIAEGSPLLGAGIPVGSVITGVNGGLFEGLTAGELGDYFLEHPIADGDIIQYRTPDGQLLEAALGISGRFVQEVRLIAVEPFDLTASDFSAELQFELRREAEYRLVDADGNVISDWQRQGPTAIVNMNSSTMTRNADDEYELFIERRIGEKVKRFQIPFKLEADAAPTSAPLDPPLDVPSDIPPDSEFE